MKCALFIDARDASPAERAPLIEVQLQLIALLHSKPMLHFGGCFIGWRAVENFGPESKLKVAFVHTGLASELVEELMKEMNAMPTAISAGADFSVRTIRADELRAMILERVGGDVANHVLPAIQRAISSEDGATLPDLQDLADKTTSDKRAQNEPGDPAQHSQLQDPDWN